MKGKNIFIRRILFILIFLFFALTLIPKQVKAAEIIGGPWDISKEQGVDNVTATLYDDGKLVIEGTGAMKDWSVFSDAEWYLKSDEIEFVEIKSGVTSIGSNAFWGCKSLANITIPEGVVSIGSNAFCGCSSLTNITIPSSVANIEYKTFSECKSLKRIDVDINNKNYSSQEGVLYDKNRTTIIKCPAKTNLTSITIPIGVTSICKEAFSYCSDLTSITIPEGITSIESGAFRDCRALTSITIPNGVTNIYDDTFKNCQNLASVKIPEDVISIGNGAFYDCFNLTSIKISENVISIGEDAFFACFNLTSITIPNSVTSIGEDAFLACMKLTSINVDNNNKKYLSINGVLYNKNKTELICCPAGTPLTSIEIPESVMSIGDYAFGGCSSLKSITIPNSVTSIGEDAFEDCSEDLTIYCYKNSTAEEYAKANNIKYEYLDEKKFNLTIDPDGGQMILPKTGNSETQTTTEAYNNLEFTYGTQRLFMKTAYIATTADKDKAWLGTYSGKAINGDNLMIKDGCKFKQWKIISGEGQIIDETVEDEKNGIIHNYYYDGNCEGDVIIQAEWEPLPTITVDPNGANMKLVKDEIISQPQSVTFYHGNKEKRVFAKVGKISGAENSQDKWFCFTRVNNLNVPYREGYNFDGWKITKGEGEISQETDSEGRYIYYYDCSYNGNITIQAQWKKIDDEEPEQIKIEIKENPQTIKSTSKIEEKIYLIVDPKTNARDIFNDLTTNVENIELEIIGATSNEEKVKTNQKIAIKESDEATNMVVIVKGDVDSDGEVSFRDVMKLNNYRLNKEGNKANWNSAEKIAYKSITENEIANEEIGEILFRNIITLNNFRLRN